MYTPFHRETNRKLGWLLIVAGILLAPDVTVPTPFMDLLLNVPLAIMFALVFNVTFIEAMLFTFMLAYAMIVVGVLILPYNTRDFIHSKVTTGLMYVVANPMMAVISVGVLLVIIFIGNQWFVAYEETLRAYIADLMLKAGVS